MHGFFRELLTEWRRLDLPFKGETLVAGVSGGADSISLLLALNELSKTGKLANRIVVAHFDHGLRGDESRKDAEFVRGIAEGFGLELALGHARKLGEADGNLEQNARRARYDFLAETARGLHAFGILTAHTMNDQAETFLLNLIRGSGPDGLSGMSAMRTVERAGPDGKPFRTKLIRPLLNWAKRRDTEDLCAMLGVEYRYDTMNEDLAFTRVRIRKLLLPMLKDFNPNIVETLARTADLMRTAAGGEGQAAAAAEGDATLAVKGLAEMPEAERATAVRNWLKGVRGGLRSIDRRNLEAIVRLALSTKSGRTVELPGGGRVTKQGGRLAFENIKVDK